MPKISILMTVYNGGLYLKQSINRVLMQSFGDFEFIIVDDGSTDNTKEIIALFKDERIMLKKLKENIGRIKALKLGFSLCKGEYISILDADDIYERDKLKEQSGFLDSNNSVGLVSCDYYIINDKDKIIGSIQGLSSHNRNIRQELLKENFIKHSSVMFRRAIYESIGGYRLEFQAALDYDFLLRVSEYTEIFILDKILFRYRMTYEQMSCKKFLIQQELYKLAKELAIERRSCGIDRLEICSQDEKENFIRKRIGCYLLKNSKTSMLGSLLWAFQISISFGFIKEAFRVILKTAKKHPFEIRVYLSFFICLLFYLRFLLNKFKVTSAIEEKIGEGIKENLIYNGLKRIFLK